jgi:hypothetical protein
MVTATVAEITAYGVNIKGPDGHTIKSRSANLRDPQASHGINLDEGDQIVEQLGYTPGTWRWVDNGGFYKAVAMSDADAEARQRRKYGKSDREAGGLNQRAVNLQIAATGKRPSGKPLTPEMQQWVREYRAGKREFP